MTATSSFTTQLKFAHALSIVRAIPPNSPLQPIAADKLQFYGLYKQATEGDIQISKPSSRQIVEYAKWKAWSRMKGLSPIEAQKLYIESLVQLLTEFIHRYPNHKQSIFIKKALNSLQFDKQADSSSLQEDDDLFQDAYDPTEFELQEHFLNHIEADQIMKENILNSPPASTPQSSFYYDHRHSSIISDVHTTDYPITPITSPGQNFITGQWLQSQLQQHNKNSYVHPMDLNSRKDDVISEPDTIDREVAAATANLSLASPRQSPYSSNSKRKSLHHQQDTSSHPPSASTSTDKPKKSDRALEKLQTEVTALTEQIDRLRSSIKSKEDRDKQLRWSTVTIIKVLMKHILANSAILLIIFYILWRRKSPIAYAIIGHITPLIQDIMRKLLQKIVFWKVTV